MEARGQGRGEAFEKRGEANQRQGADDDTEEDDVAADAEERLHGVLHAPSEDSAEGASVGTAGFCHAMKGMVERTGRADGTGGFAGELGGQAEKKGCEQSTAVVRGEEEIACGCAVEHAVCDGADEEERACVGGEGGEALCLVAGEGGGFVQLCGDLCADGIAGEEACGDGKATAAADAEEGAHHRVEKDAEEARCAEAHEEIRADDEGQEGGEDVVEPKEEAFAGGGDGLLREEDEKEIEAEDGGGEGEGGYV